LEEEVKMAEERKEEGMNIVSEEEVKMTEERARVKKSDLARNDCKRKPSRGVLMTEGNARAPIPPASNQPDLFGVMEGTLPRSDNGSPFPPPHPEVFPSPNGTTSSRGKRPTSTSSSLLSTSSALLKKIKVVFLNKGEGER
jgi:hypothetical protein